MNTKLDACCKQRIFRTCPPTRGPGQDTRENMKRSVLRTKFEKSALVRSRMIRPHRKNARESNVPICQANVPICQSRKPSGKGNPPLGCVNSIFRRDRYSSRSDRIKSRQNLQPLRYSTRIDIALRATGSGVGRICNHSGHSKRGN